jgi:hypothetical protein
MTKFDLPADYHSDPESLISVEEARKLSEKMASN